MLQSSQLGTAVTRRFKRARESDDKLAWWWWSTYLFIYFCCCSNSSKGVSHGNLISRARECRLVTGQTACTYHLESHLAGVLLVLPTKRICQATEKKIKLKVIVQMLQWHSKPVTGKAWSVSVQLVAILVFITLQWIESLSFNLSCIVSGFVASALSLKIGRSWLKRNDWFTTHTYYIVSIPII